VGNPATFAYTGATEEYDGTSWTSSPTLNTTRGYIGGAGTQTAALGFGGFYSHLVTGATEEYDGSTWTSVWKFKYSKNSFQQVVEHKLQH
jgi:hypothetical protein